MKESGGNFFQKVSSGASPLRHFLFASFSFVPEHPVNQSPSAVGASFSPRRHTTLSAYKICPRSCYLPEAKNILPTVLRSFSLCEKPNGFGLPDALSKEKEEVWNLMTQWVKQFCVRCGRKVTLSFVLSTSLAVFLCRCRRKEKLSKETPFSKGNFLKKVSFGLLQKLFGSRRRNVGAVRGVLR